ncbi:MAG: hypothetical protein ACFFG0_00120 [Candidatus Thorarchaeota archaeon]
MDNFEIMDINEIVDERMKCSPCWAHNSYRYGQIFFCEIYLRDKTNGFKDCPCRTCLVRAACMDRCEKQFSFDYDGAISLYYKKKYLKKV